METSDSQPPEDNNIVAVDFKLLQRNEIEDNIN